MNKTTKGVLAATTAAAILMGGAGSLAYWSDGDTVNGGSFNSGKLTLKTTVVAPNTTPCDANWVHTNGPKSGSVVKNVVPGDVITKTCTFVVGAVGDNLEATPTVPGQVTLKSVTGNTAESLSLPVTATYKLDGAALTGSSLITESADGKVLAATIKVAFPYGSDTVNVNNTQNLNVALNDLTVSLKQNNKGA